MKVSIGKRSKTAKIKNKKLRTHYKNADINFRTLQGGYDRNTHLLQIKTCQVISEIPVFMCRKVHGRQVQ